MQGVRLNVPVCSEKQFILNLVSRGRLELELFWLLQITTARMWDDGTTSLPVARSYFWRFQNHFLVHQKLFRINWHGTTARSGWTATCCL
jgi:hypothetical protein